MLLVLFLVFLAGILSLLLTYYSPLVTDIWIGRFRIVDDMDHVGPVLELGQLFLILGALWFLGDVIFPTAFPGLHTWWFWILGATTAIITLFFCMVLGPDEIKKEVKSNPRYKKYVVSTDFLREGIFR